MWTDKYIDLMITRKELCVIINTKSSNNELILCSYYVEVQIIELV